MSLIGWISDPANWAGADGVPARLLEHLYYSGLTLLIAVVIAVPIGILVGHTGKGGFGVLGTANGLRALPDLGLLILLVLLVGIHLVPVVVALLVMAIPPLLAGSYSGVRNVDASVVDAARGVGMREREILLKVELPNALPLLLGGLRAATLQVIATAAIAAYVSYGGLGRFIIDGQANHVPAEMAAGAVLIAVLALTVEGLLALLQRAVVSPGLRLASAAQHTRRRPKTPQGPRAEAPRSATSELTGARA
jgi:osmoprotectant transport system permease protein